MNPLSYLNDDAIKKLFSDLQLEDATPEEKQQFLADLSENLVGEIMVSTLENIPENLHGEYADLLDKGDIEGVVTLLKPHIPDFSAHVQKIVDQQLAELKELI